MNNAFKELHQACRSEPRSELCPRHAEVARDSLVEATGHKISIELLQLRNVAVYAFEVCRRCFSEWLRTPARERAHSLIGEHRSGRLKFSDIDVVSSNNKIQKNHLQSSTFLQRISAFVGQSAIPCEQLTSSPRSEPA